MLNFVASPSELQRQLNHRSDNPIMGYAIRIVSGDGSPGNNSAFKLI
jgi:hypothetical protein